MASTRELKAAGREPNLLLLSSTEINMLAALPPRTSPGYHAECCSQAIVLFLLRSLKLLCILNDY
jgi:hypothetical protein